MSADLAAETVALQGLLEARRADPAAEHIDEDVERARAAVEVAWLERGHGQQ